LTGRQAVADLAEVEWDEVDRVFVIVRMTDQAAEVLEKLPITGREIACHVVTTLEPPFANRLAEFSRAGRRIIEQPVSGGELGAMAGSLTILTGGEVTDADEDFLRATLAKDVVRFDQFGEPTKAKLLNNITGAYNAQVLASMLGLARDEGLDVRKFYRVLLTSSGGSWMAGGFLELLDEMLAKDVRLLRENLGGLPNISLDAEADFVGDLGRARALLNGQ
jgi:3-hydroxyisobutyrate dehydrogenase